MNTLQAGQFYKTCAAFPLDLKRDSPLKVHGLLMEDSPQKGIPIRVCEDTTMWHIQGVKVAKPHSCYLVSFDASMSIGVIFLGSSSPQAYPHRFVKVHSTVESSPVPENALGTIPPNGFPSSFSLNITHPLRVKLVHVAMGTSLNSLKHHPIPFGPPPPMGITEYRQDIPILPICLNPESEDVFWSLHKRYNKIRPGRNFQVDGGQGGNNGPQGGGNSGGSAQGGNSGGSAQGGSSPHGGMGGACSGGPGRQIGAGTEAPWDRIGGFRIGIDIPLVTEEMDSDVEYSDEEELEEDFDIVDGIVYVQHFDSTRGVEACV